MLGELYVPKGLALETAKAVLGIETDIYAVNVASGCDGKCEYCYLDKAMGCKKGEIRYPKIPPVDRVKKQFDKGLKPKGVFLCFLTDPFTNETNKKATEDVIRFLNEQGVKNIATLSKMDITDWRLDLEIKHGMTVVSVDDRFWQVYESNRIKSQQRIATLEMRKHMEGNFVWISMEPYPVNDIFKQDIRDVLHQIEFVNLIVFGAWNYNPIARTPKALQEYKEYVNIVQEFGKEHKIKVHIKSDTLKLIEKIK